VELPLLSVLRNKSSSSLKAILTSPSAVHHVGKQGKQSAMGVVATVPDAECSLPYVLSAVTNAKYLSSLVRVGLCIVLSATIRSD